MNAILHVNEISYAQQSRDDAVNQANALCRGSYQLALISGEELYSGSSLKGKAAKYSGKYKKSRDNLFTRLAKNNVSYAIVARRSGRLSVVFGSANVEYAKKCAKSAMIRRNYKTNKLYENTDFRQEHAIYAAIYYLQLALISLNDNERFRTAKENFVHTNKMFQYSNIPKKCKCLVY